MSNYQTQIPENHVSITAFENAISRFAVGTIWKLTLSEQDNDARYDSFRMTKSRPYLIIGQTNSTVDIVPLSSTNNNMKNDVFSIKIPRVDGNEQSYSYVVLPKKEKISYVELLDKYPKYLCTISRQMLLRILATNAVFETLSLSNDEVKIVANMTVAIRESINSINYFNSPYMKYLDMDIETMDIETENTEPDDNSENNVEFVAEPAHSYIINSFVTDLANKLVTSPVSPKATVIGSHSEVIGDILFEDDKSNININDFIIIYEHISGIKLLPSKLENILSDLGYKVDNSTIVNANLHRFVTDGKIKEYREMINAKYPHVIACIITGMSYSATMRSCSQSGVNINPARSEKIRSKMNLSEMYRLNYDINKSDTTFDILKKMVRKTDSPTTTSKEIFDKLHDLGISKSQSDIEQSLKLSGFRFKFKDGAAKWNVEIIPYMGYNFDAIVKLAKTDLGQKILSIVNGSDKISRDNLSTEEKKILDAYTGWREQNVINEPTDDELVHTVNSHSLTYAALYYGINYRTVVGRCQRFRKQID